MLIGINPLLTPDLLHAIASMGHGDEIVISDANFPAATRGVPCIEMPGCDASQLLDALLELFPLDYRFESPAFSMSSKEGEVELSEAAIDYQRIIQAKQGENFGVQPLQRDDFYKRACSAYRVVRTGDRRKFANVIIRKGVV